MLAGTPRLKHRVCVRSQLMGPVSCLIRRCLAPPHPLASPRLASPSLASEYREYRVGLTIHDSSSAVINGSLRFSRRTATRVHLIFFCGKEIGSFLRTVPPSEFADGVSFLKRQTTFQPLLGTSPRSRYACVRSYAKWTCLDVDSVGRVRLFTPKLFISLPRVTDRVFAHVRAHAYDKRREYVLSPDNAHRLVLYTFTADSTRRVVKTSERLSWLAMFSLSSSSPFSLSLSNIFRSNCRAVCVATVFPYNFSQLFRF